MTRGGGGFGSGFRPERWIGEKARDELGVKGVAGALGDDEAAERTADEREVADEIERLVAAEFVGETERAVDDGVAGEDESVLVGTAADEAHLAHAVEIALEAEGAGGSEQMAEGIAIDVKIDVLAADGGMREVDGAPDAEFFSGINADAAAGIGDFEWLKNAEITPAAAEGTDAGAGEHLDEGLSGAVEDGNFDGVEVDETVVHAAGVKRGEQMLRGGDEHAFLHEAGGVTDASDVADVGLDGEIVEVGAAEDDSGVGRGRSEAEVTRNGGVQTNARGLYRALDCGLEGHSCVRSMSKPAAKLESVTL